MAVRHTVTSYRKGLNLADPSSGAGKIPVPPFMGAAQGWKTYYYDFATGEDFADASGGYEITVEGTTPTIAAGVNGVLLSTTTADNSSALLQHLDPQIQLSATATKKFYMETSLVLTAAAVSSTEVFVGFTSDQQTTNFVAAAGTSWAFDDGFGFGQLDGASNFDFISRQSDVEQTVSYADAPTTGVRVTYSAYHDGTNFNIYKDGVLVSSEARVTLNTDALMGMAAYVKAGTGAAKTLTVNYLTLSVEL